MVSQAFSVVLPKDPFDSGFASLCDAEAIFTRDSNSARQRLLDNLSYQLIDVRTILSQNPSGAGQEAMQKLVRNMQISLQYVIHRLGCYRMEIKDIKKERDELFDELVFLRDSAALSQKKLKQLQQQQHGLNQSVDTSYGGGGRSRSQQHHQQGSGSSSKKEYKCRICGNVYPIQYALTSHMLKRHSHEAAGLSAGGGSVDPMNHTDGWHTSSFPHQRGAALAGGDMTAMYPGGAAGLPSTTTNSPAPKLPSQGRGPGLVDPISDSIDHKLEVSQITELKSEISNLKRSLESVTVELRVSQELQRDRESQMREVQEELRRSVSPASLRNSVAAVQQEQQQLSPPSSSSAGVDVMSSAETLVLLRNQGSRLESIERALHTQQQLQAMQQQQQLHAVDLSNVQQANTPSQASPFSIPNFNAAAKSAIKDGGTGSNGPPSSGRSGKQTSFASGLMMDSTPHAASLATRTSPGKQVTGTASSSPSTPLTKKTSPIPGPMSTTVLGGKTTTTTTASAKEELKANNPSTPTRPTTIAASKTVAASPDDDDEVVVTTAGNSTAATPNSTKKVLTKAIEDEKDNSQPDASTEPAVTTWRPPAANKATKKSMIVPTPTSNTTPVPVKKRPSETNFDSDSESGSIPPAVTGTPGVKQASPVAQEPDRPSTTSPSEVPVDNEVSTTKRIPTPSTPGVPTPVSLPQEETPVSSSPPPPPSSAPADEPPVVSDPMVDPAAAAAALNGGAAAVPPDSARSNTTTGTSTSSGSSGTSTSSSGGGGDTAAPSAPSTARGENDEAREQQGDEFTANQMAALKQKYAASVSSSSTTAAAAKASAITASPVASTDPPTGEETPIGIDQPSGVVPVVTTVAPVTTMVAPATTGVPAVGVLGAPRAKKKPLSLFGGASAGGGAGSGLGTGGIKAHDDDDDDESF